MISRYLLTQSASRVAKVAITRAASQPLMGAPRSLLQRSWFSSYPPHEVLGMPALSPTMESGQIGQWNVKEGDEFSAGDTFCQIQTDKAEVDFEAQDDGFVAKLLHAEGDSDIKVNEPILIVVEDAGDVAAFKDYVHEGGSAATPEPAAQVKAPEAQAQGQGQAQVKAPEPAAASPPPSSPAPRSSSSSNSGSSGHIVASPLAFKLAKELGHDLSKMEGTGPGGRILADDVREYVPPVEGMAQAEQQEAAPSTAASASAPPPPPIFGSGYTDYPLSAEAQEVAARLVQSKRNVPHYYLTVDVRLDRMLELRKSLNGAVGEDGSISLNDLLLKASACAMKTVPEVNGSWALGGTVVRVYDNVDINVVMQDSETEQLVTPRIGGVNQLGVAAIGKAVKAAASGEHSDFEMGTFSVVNLGMYGIRSAAPIIMEPQSCMLSLGTAENRVVPADDPDQVYQQAVMLTATLSCDHRVVDGAVGAQWLAAFKGLVENPNTLLL